MALVKGIFDDGGNSYADRPDWVGHFPSGIGYDGSELDVELGIAPVDAEKAAMADTRLINASRWIDAQRWKTGRERIRGGDDATATPPLLSLPRDRWIMAAGSAYILEGVSLNTDPPSVPWVIIAATVEVAEVLRVNGCLSPWDNRNPSDVLKERDVHGHLESEWIAPLASQLFDAARQYLAGLVVTPGKVPRGMAF